MAKSKDFRQALAESASVESANASEAEAVFDAAKKSCTVTFAMFTTSALNPVLLRQARAPVIMPSRRLVSCMHAKISGRTKRFGDCAVYGMSSSGKVYSSSSRVCKQAKSSSIKSGSERANPGVPSPKKNSGKEHVQASGENILSGFPVGTRRAFGSAAFDPSASAATCSNCCCTALVKFFAARFKS